MLLFLHEVHMFATPRQQRTQTRKARTMLSGPSVVVWWRVRDSNPRMLSSLIYSQIPLAAWVTRHCALSDTSQLLTEGAR